jgi:N-acetylneuraminic acid mutarotase
MPQGSWGQGFGIINGKLYVAGGSDGVTQLNTLYIYDIASNTWTTGMNVPVAVEWAGSAVLRNDLYLFGGLPPFVTTQIYNPVSNSWTTGPDMGVYRFRFYGTAVGNHSIVALGGADALGFPLELLHGLRAAHAGTQLREHGLRYALSSR